MPAKFIAEEGALKGLELLLEDGDSWIIGRDPDVCQILIEDPSVSRRHILCKKSDLGITIENLSDSNKAFLNDQEILSPTVLQNSDFLRIGSGSYRFYTDDENHENLSLESSQSLIETPLEEKEEIAAEDDILEEEKEEEEKEEELLEPLADDSLQSDQAVELEKEDSIFYENDEDDSEKALANINFDYSDPGRFLLKVISGANNGAEFSMQAGHTYVVGKDPSTADIIFNDNSVSRQHVRLSIDEEDKISIEDLKSKNGTLVDGEPLTEKKELESNALVTIGTTSFIIYDKESAMQTVISPLMPSIVKILQQKEEAKRLEEEEKEKGRALAREQAENAVKEAAHEKKSTHNAHAFILISIITGLFTLAAIATTTLFKEEPVVSEYSANIDNMLSTALSPFPNIKYNFNKATGVLLLAGHVLTQTDKNQLLYNLQGLRFIKNLDDTGVVIDELAWREINPTLNKNPSWRSVSIQSPAPGKFVLSGYLQTRKESEQLWDYVSNNFPYISLLERKVVVEEDVISNISSMLLHEDFKDVTVQMSEGEITLTGFIPTNRQEALNKILSDIKEIPGIRGLRSYVTELAGDQSMVNLSDKYEVTGYSHQGRGNLSVIINGRILIRGDVLDGMLITSIKPNAIFLEKDGVKYRIDYNK